MNRTRNAVPEDAFQALLEGGTNAAPDEVKDLVKVAAALRPAVRSGPSSQFKARLRNELLAMASAPEDETFAALLEGRAIAPEDELAPLAKLATALVAVGAPMRAVPAPPFRFQLRNRLLVESAKPHLRGRFVANLAGVNARLRRSFRAVGATGVAAAFALSSGAALAASHGALPGDPILYKIKRGHESAQLLVISGEREGLRLIEFARTRYDEVVGLTTRGEDDRQLYVETLDDMDEQTLRGADIIATVGKRESLAKVLAFAKIQEQDLSVLIEQLPPGARPAARDSLIVAQKVGERADLILRGCPCDPPANALVEPATSPDSGTAGDTQTCRFCAGSSGGSSDGGSSQPGGSPDGGTDGGAGRTSPPPPPIAEDTNRFDDVPDVPGTTVDDTTKDALDGVLDDLGAPKQTLPVPSASLPVAETPSSPLPFPRLI